jgi:hypothetical protein
MIDRTTKMILILAVLGLWLNAIAPLFHPKSVAAQNPFTCTGEIKVNAWGATTTSIGGYNVKLDCSR